MCLFFKMFKPLFWLSFNTYCKIKRLMFRLLHIITWNLDVGNNYNTVDPKDSFSNTTQMLQNTVS